MSRKKTKIGIVGHGFVGKATDWGFNVNVDKFIVDPVYDTKISDLSAFGANIIFICVPTPMEDDGSQNSDIIKNVVKELSINCPKAIKVVKSTVLPSVLQQLYEIDSNLVYNPEFLREKHANEDFMNSKIIILGGEESLAKTISKAYLNHSQCLTKEHIFTDLATASLIKYSINTFLASKVIFFNEIFDIFTKLEVTDSWQHVIETISKDERMGTSHMDVPGHDGKKGFGGACFPKDTVAFAKYASNIESELSVLKAAISKNNRIRSKYDLLDSREAEQNVSFDDKI